MLAAYGWVEGVYVPCYIRICVCVCVSVYVHVHVWLCVCLQMCMLTLVSLYSALQCRNPLIVSSTFTHRKSRWKLCDSCFYAFIFLKCILEKKNNFLISLQIKKYVLTENNLLNILYFAKPSEYLSIILEYLVEMNGRPVGWHHNLTSWPSAIVGLRRSFQ